ncbi:MAG: hypothetical protein ACOCUI_03800 [bacterium]
MDNFLKSVDKDKTFWFVSGESANSLESIVDKLKTITNDIFDYHVNSDKNDIASWIKFVIGDNELANKLKITLTKKQFADTISKRVKELKKLYKKDEKNKKFEKKSEESKDNKKLSDKNNSKKERKSENEEYELPSLNKHLKQRRVNQIKELLEEINYKIIHHSDILDKYEKIRELYKKIDKEHKQEVFGDVVKTYNKMQELWQRINY